MTKKQTFDFIFNRFTFTQPCSSTVGKHLQNMFILFKADLHLQVLLQSLQPEQLVSLMQLLDRLSTFCCGIYFILFPFAFSCQFYFSFLSSKKCTTATKYNATLCLWLVSSDRLSLWNCSYLLNSLSS